MKKLIYLIVLALILGLALAGCTFLSNIGQAPATGQSGITYLTKAMLSPDDLVGLWHFDGDALDSSGDANDGMVFGGATYVDSPMGQALSFDGVNDYVEVPDDVTLDITGEITIEAWLKTNVINKSWDVAVGKFQSGVGDTFQLGFNEASQRIYFELRTPLVTKRVRSNDVPIIGTWYHVAGVRESSGSMKLYIDGKLQTETDTISGDLRVNASTLWIGGVQSGSYYFNGLIDEVRIWNVALSLEQLNEVYDFDGFYPPVENLPIGNVVKAGRAIPVKFSLSGDQGLNIFEDGYPKSIPILCPGKDEPVGVMEFAETAGESSLSYDDYAEQYIYVWKTEKTWANSCRKLVVVLNDGTYHEAHFTFK